MKGYRRQKFSERHQAEVGAPGAYDFDFTILTADERATLETLMQKAVRK